MPLKYSIVTFGCRVNQADSLGFEEQLLAANLLPSSPDEADLVVVNTCSVTASADQGARQTIRRVARENPGARIVVTGCYATRRPEDVRDLPGVVGVVANDDKPRLIAITRGTLAGSVSSITPDDSEGTTAQRFGDGDGGCGAVITPGVAGRTAFTLRVQTGCSEPCAYCIIPATRGLPRSRPTDEVLAEAARVTSAGFKEIALTGVHLGSYGRDLTPASSLAALLNALAACARRATEPHEASATPLFRISSLEPMDCTEAVVALVAEDRCFAPHFHLPLQHASNRMLRGMRRPYTIEYYASLVDGIRSRIPHAALGTDVIVGFPGETDQDFEELAAYLERSPLTHVHVFPYSDRPGTAASSMPDKVPGVAIRERARRVRELAAALNRRFRDSQIGALHQGLTLEDGSLVVTGNYLKLRISPAVGRNEWVRVVVRSHHHGERLAG
jgi:threonylcarbamoyladenosine tRNA methylthiotransferase MtaB